MYTPGNFIADKDCVYTDTGVFLCSVGGRFHSNVEQRVAEREANARLFSASPELLACVQAMMSGMPLKDVVVLAANALAKANVATLKAVDEVDNVGA